MRKILLLQLLQLVKEEITEENYVHKFALFLHMNELEQQVWPILPSPKPSSLSLVGPKNCKNNLAEDGFDPSTSGLWAQHASAAPLRCLDKAAKLL